MSFDAEQMRHKRQQREQERRRKRRNLLIKLFVAAVVLAAVAVTIVVISQSGGQVQEPTQPPATVPSDPSDPSGATDPAAEEIGDTVIHFVTTGDLNINDKSVAAGGAAFDYTNLFMDVAPLLADADLTAVNLEGNLCGSPYGSDTGSAPQNMATALSRAGVDIIQLANSFSVNRGPSGLSATIDAVRAAGMEPVGAYKDEADFQQSRGYSLFMVKGIKIAVVAFTKGVSGMTILPGNENCVNLLYTDYDSNYQKVDTQRITSIMEAVNEENPDLVIALVHWGSTYNDTISSSQYTICNLLKEKGADAIIGTHSHYIEKMELDPEAGTFVAWGLGDFVSDIIKVKENGVVKYIRKAGTEYGVVLDLEITKTQDGQTKITGYSYTPTFCIYEEGEPMRVVRTYEAMRAYENGNLGSVTQEIYDDMAYSLWRIQARTDGE